MDKMSPFSITTVSIPESIIFVLLISVIVGKKNIFKLKKINNIIKIVITIMLFTITAVTTRSVSSSLILNQSINLVLAIAILIFICNFEIHKAIIGFLLNIIICSIIEVISIFITAYILNVDWDIMYKSDYLRLIFSIPPRIVELFLIRILYLLPKPLIDLKIFRSAYLLKKIKNVYIILTLCFLQIIAIIEHCVLNKKCKNTYDLEFTIYNIFISIIISLCIIVWLINSARILRNTKNDELNNLILIQESIDSCKKGKINLDNIKNIVDNAIKNSK